MAEQVSEVDCMESSNSLILTKDEISTVFENIVSEIIKLHGKRQFIDFNIVCVCGLKLRSNTHCLLYEVCSWCDKRIDGTLRVNSGIHKYYFYVKHRKDDKYVFVSMSGRLTQQLLMARKTISESI